MKINVTPTSISSRASINKKLFDELGEAGEKWLKETNERICPIMEEQTKKLSEIMGKKFGFTVSEAHAGDEADFSDFLKEMFT